MNSMNTIRTVATIILLGLWTCLIVQCAAPVPMHTSTPQATPPHATTVPPTSAPVVYVPSMTALYATNDPPQLVITATDQQYIIKVDAPLQQAVPAAHMVAVRDADQHIRIIDTRTSRVTPLAMACDDIAWHTPPDTLWCIAYANLYIVTPTRTTLTAVASPGSALLHAVARPNTAELWAIQVVDGRHQLCRIVPTVACVADADQAQWRPDGQQIALVRADTIQLIDEAGTLHTTFTHPSIRSVYWVDNTTLLLVTTQAVSLYTVDTRQTTPAPAWLVPGGLLSVHQ